MCNNIINFFANLVLVLLLLLPVACSTKKGEKKDTSELWSKAMTTRELVKRSGTKFTSQKARDSGLMERDIKTRLQTGGGLFGKQGISLSADGFGNNDKAVASVGMPINPYLWRAGLESTSFLPLSSANPFAGIIITDWYNDRNNLNERCKINIFVKGVELTTNNLKASIFCQEKISNNWIDKKVDNDKNIAFENAILEKAKRLRISSQ